MEKELRTNHAELRVSDDKNGGLKISGYAAVFDQDSEDLGGFVERIAPGAFKEALKNSDARALINHNQDLLLARESAGTLRLRETDEGLYMEISPPKTSYAADLMESIKRGDIAEQSFAFTVAKDEWQHLDTPDREAIRTITEISHLYDVGPVTYPAYPQTSAALRSMERARGQESDDGLLDDLLVDDDFDSVLDDL
jgi:HK97 family phage prohead protease